MNSHFNTGKGYKFDVAVPYEDRAPHVADRLGHPYLLGTPLERLFLLESFVYHPGFNNQPFTQTPPVDADADVNFEEGDVLYENTMVSEWAKFWHLAMDYTLSYLLIWHPYHTFVKNSNVINEYIYDFNFFYATYNVNNFDNWAFELFIPAGVGAIFLYSKLLTAKNTSFFASKLQYNRDQDLLFLTIPPSSIYGAEKEIVMEMDHVEILPPEGVDGMNYLSAFQEDGYYTINELN